MTRREKNDIDIWREEALNSHDVNGLTNRAKKKNIVDAINFIADNILPSMDSKDFDITEKLCFEYSSKFVINTNMLEIDLLAMHLLSSITGQGFALMPSDDGLKYRFMDVEEFSDDEEYNECDCCSERDKCENSEDKNENKGYRIINPKGTFYAPGDKNEGIS